MRALVYRITKHSIPGWSQPIHDKYPRGIAYESDNHFIHFYGEDKGLWLISPGLTVAQKKSGTLRDWIALTFGAEGVELTDGNVGHTIQGVWRPGLYSNDEIFQGLDATSSALRLSEQVLLLLVQRLDELLHFIEPSSKSLQTYSHKARELLILSCTEVENSWKSYTRMAGLTPQSAGDLTTRDYIKLKSALHLGEVKISLPRYTAIPPILPFHGWSVSQPTKSLPWYDAYNKTKHDRTANFSEANLWNCLQAIAANLALFLVRFGPANLFHGGGTLAAFANQLFAIDLENCRATSFYSPKLNLPHNLREDLFCFDARAYVAPRIVDQFRLSQ